MIGTFAHSRWDILENIIKNSPLTPDGFHVSLKFSDALMETVPKDCVPIESGFKLPRITFKNFKFFTPTMIRGFICPFDKPLEANYIDYITELNNYVNRVVKNDWCYANDLNRRIPGTEYSLGDLIDSTVFYFHNKK